MGAAPGRRVSRAGLGCEVLEGEAAGKAGRKAGSGLDRADHSTKRLGGPSLRLGASRWVLAPHPQRLLLWRPGKINPYLLDQLGDAV